MIQPCDANMPYDHCMATRQQLMQQYLAVPADAREQHWLFGDVRSRDLEKSAVRMWLEMGIARLQVRRPRLP